MTNGQVTQLQELSKCYIAPYGFMNWVRGHLKYGVEHNIEMTKRNKKFLRRLTHQYRHQIKAMKRNRTVTR